MRNIIGISSKEKEDILKQHNTVYDGYAVGNVNTNMYPLTVRNDAKDSQGVTVTNTGEVKPYTNHNINEIAAKPLNYDEIDPAYEFDSEGPGDENLGYNVYSDTEQPYDFDSEGPSDVYNENNCEECDDNLKEHVNKTLDMFKRIKKFN